MKSFAPCKENISAEKDPGEDEMLALAMNGIGVLKGEVTAKEYK